MKPVQSDRANGSGRSWRVSMSPRSRWRAGRAPRRNERQDEIAPREATVRYLNLAALADAELAGLKPGLHVQELVQPDRHVVVSSPSRPAPHPTQRRSALESRRARPTPRDPTHRPLSDRPRTRTGSAALPPTAGPPSPLRAPRGVS